jgi:hypothetical protein
LGGFFNVIAANPVTTVSVDVVTVPSGMIAAGDHIVLHVAGERKARCGIGGRAGKLMVKLLITGGLLSFSTVTVTVLVMISGSGRITKVETTQL